MYKDDFLSLLYISLIEGIDLLLFPSEGVLKQRVNIYAKNFVKKIKEKKEFYITELLSQRNKNDNDENNTTDEEYLSICSNKKIKSVESLCATKDSKLDLNLERATQTLLELGLKDEAQIMKKIFYRRKKSNREKYNLKFLKGSLKFLILSLGRKGWKY